MDELCTVCGRVRWGSYQPLGNAHWRHEECAPGTPAWCLKFSTLSKKDRTIAGEMIYASKQPREEIAAS